MVAHHHSSKQMLTNSVLTPQIDKKNILKYEMFVHTICVPGPLLPTFTAQPSVFSANKLSLTPGAMIGCVIPCRVTCMC